MKADGGELSLLSHVRLLFAGERMCVEGLETTAVGIRMGCQASAAPFSAR